MVRGPRRDIGDCVYHVINRSNGKLCIFHNERDYADFEYLLNKMRETYDIRILAYLIMPNHWPLLLYPKNDGDIRKALHWLTTSHVRRHHSRKGTIGHGHIDQGSYKSFLVQTDTYLLTVLKYIERNAVRAKLCKTVEAWRWGSAYRRLHNDINLRKILSASPVPLPRNYREWISTPEPAEGLKELHDKFNGGK